MSYYGRPVIKEPTWEAADIAGYFFLGGLAGASSTLAAGAHATGRRRLARPLKVGALGAITLSLGALVHDLGRPERFLHMLRVFKPSSPMSVGVWLLSAYTPAAGVSAASDVTGLLPAVGAAGTAGAALLGPAVASYTAVLMANTAVPAWHEPYRQVPFVFVGSAAGAAAGLGMVAAPVQEAGPARRLAVLGTIGELAASQLMQRRVPKPVDEAYRQGRAGKLLHASEVLGIAGAVGALTVARRSRLGAVASGAALLAASACTRFGLFEAGRASARDPRHTIEPQRARAAASV